MNPASVGLPPRLAELFPPESIRVGLEPRAKSAVIKELVRHAVSLGHLPRQAEGPIIDSILDREGLGSTALGNGLAFPHCQWGSLERFVGVVGLFHQGMPFDAVDGEPVDSVFLTLAPPDSPEQYVNVMGRLVAIGRNKSLHLLLRGCRTAEHVTAFLEGIDPSATGPWDELARMSLSWLERDRIDPRSELAYLSLARAHRPSSDRQGAGAPQPRWL